MSIKDLLTSIKEKTIGEVVNIKKNPKQLLFYGLAVVLICLFVFTFKLINLGPFINSFELSLFDFRTRLYVQVFGKEPDSDIVLLLHDDRSNQIINDNPEIGLTKWPFPRSVMGNVITYLKRSNAKIINFDVVFSGKSNEHDDKAFEEELKKNDNTILGFIMLRDLPTFIKYLKEEKSIDIDTYKKYKESVAAYKGNLDKNAPEPTDITNIYKSKFVDIPEEEYKKFSLNTIIEMTYMVPSGILKQFLETTSNFGILNMQTETSITEISRDYKTLYKYQNTDLFAQSLPLAAVREAFFNPEDNKITFEKSDLFGTNYLKIGKKSFALNEKGNIYLNWRGRLKKSKQNVLNFKGHGSNKLNIIPLANIFIYEFFETLNPQTGTKIDPYYRSLTEKSYFNNLIAGNTIPDIYLNYFNLNSNYLTHIANDKQLSINLFNGLYGGYQSRLYALANNINPNSLALIALNNYNLKDAYYNYSKDTISYYNLLPRSFNKVAGIPINSDLYSDRYRHKTGFLNYVKKVFDNITKLEFYKLNQKEDPVLNPIIKELNASLQLKNPYSKMNTLKELDKFLGLSLNPFKLTNKIIVVGEATATGDIHATPVAKAYPGPEIVGTAIDNLLNDGTSDSKTVLEAPLWLNAIVFIVFILLTSITILKASNFKYSLLLFFFVFLLFIMFNIIMFINPVIRIWINMIYPMFFIILTGISTIAYKNMIIDKDKKQIRNLFGKFVSPQILEAVINDPKLLSSNVPRKREMSVLFSDIRDFTTKSEISKPEELISQLNEYLTEMVEVIIMKHNGTLDKYMGDAIMAFWGDPIPMEDHALRAVLTGLAMRDHLKLLNKRWSENDKPELQIGIGVNTGEMIVGHMGSPRLIDYTVLGDNVNVASRLEGLNKQYGTDFIISESTYEYVKDYIEAEFLGPIKVKGRAQEVKVYSVIKVKDDVDVGYNTEAKLFT